MKKRLRVLVIVDLLEKPSSNEDTLAGIQDDENLTTEAHVMGALKNLGHEAKILFLYNDVNPLIDIIKEFKPDIIFNSTESFRCIPTYDMNVAALIEMLDIPYTGNSPAGLMLCRNKALAKKILSYHRIKTPAFKVFEIGTRFKNLKKLKYPIMVKPLREEASYGISQNSLVDNEKDLADRIQFVHESMNRDAIIEEYVHGRELYASLMGNRRTTMFPLRELVFQEAKDDQPKIATYQAKWNEDYRKRHKIQNQYANNLSPVVKTKIEKISKKVYRLLGLKGYARLDMRLTDQNEVVILEANPNPQIASDEDFALSASKMGISYPELIHKILHLGLKRPTCRGE